MGNNHLKKSLIPKSATLNTTTKFINKEATTLFNNNVEGNDSLVFTSLRFIQYSYQCFHQWTKQEMNEFWRFNSSIHEKTWSSVYGSATKNKKNKSGLGYTVIDLSKYPNPEFKENLSSDITIFELRVNRTIRVHGFRSQAVFYICWLDRDHKLLD
ncbi:hypothetical protein PXD56_13730 [Maribacter sp. SA7]|uniref:MAG6450 family protein n=1 Tax=Maribacter zhoushanensis TaxID=3030012 RepID=UPI0023ED764D|nr:hypothetical protein [Maribacter zhoushanensis]MDF4204028.1 hypothetical protein [Maribacter zhoushanensis]